jgi:uncharacterized membrane protein
VYTEFEKDVIAFGASCMGDMIQWLQQHVQEHSLVYFIALYIGGGKPVALLTAKMCGLNLFWLFPLVILMDAVQIPCFDYAYRHMFSNRRLRRAADYLQNRCNAITDITIFQKLRSWGPLGVLLLSMLPLKGGGIWSAVFLARLLGMPMALSFPLLISGSILISLLCVGLGDSVLRLWQLLA